MDELARKRAEKENDSRLWSCEDALEDVLARIRSGELNPSQLSINYLQGSAESGYRHGYCVAGLTYPAHIALLHLSLDRVIRDWTA